MSKEIRKVAIIGGSRIPFVKSFSNYLRLTNSDLMLAVMKNLVEKFHLEGELIGDVAIGAVMKHPNDWNLAREVVLDSGLHPNTPAYNVQRACGTSLDCTNQIALKIATGQIEVGIAGGTDTNSDIPITFSHELSTKLLQIKAAKGPTDYLKILMKLSPKDLIPKLPAVVELRTHLSMGEHCEKMVKEWNIARVDQDELTYNSHKNGALAYNEGFYDDLVFEYKKLTKDTILRENTTTEKLARLNPAFDKSDKGTLTAGNSTALSDGASAVLLASEEYAKKHKLEVMAYFSDCEASAVNFVAGDGLLMAPTIAVANLLKRNNLKLQDFDFYEIHEAFAGQVLCTLKAWESADYCKHVLNLNAPLGKIDRAKMNVKGGSVALGHPFAATGTRLVATLAKTLKEKGKGRGLISACTAGGMGVAAILEL
ncbi:MAG: acetyl-CoA C-acetyltransferase [Bacteriovoracaceae bacterium]